MTYGSGDLARLSVETHDDLLHVEVRNHKLRLVASGLKLRDVELAAGVYVVSVRLPGHEELLQAVELAPGERRRVDLVPESQLLYPRARYIEGFETAKPSEDLEIAERSQVGWKPSIGEPAALDRSAAPRWSLRFFGSGADLRLTPLRWTPDVAVREDTPTRTVLQITVPEQAVVFAQMAREGEVPLNVALPAIGVDASATCMLTAQLRAGQLFLGALPVGSRLASRAAEYLAAGQVRQGAAVVGTREAEGLLGGELIDPMSAAVGGYLLLRASELDRLHDWPERLAVRFPWLSDGAVIAGETAARRGQITQAVQHFLEVPSRGLPIFTDGYSMLVARVRRYQANAKLGSAIDPRDHDVLNRFLRRVTEWSAFIDFSAPTLTFRAADPNDPAASQTPLDPSSSGWVFTRPPAEARPAGAGPASETADATVIAVDFRRVLAAAAREAGVAEAAHATSTLSKDTRARFYSQAGVDEIEVTVFTTRAEWRRRLLPVQVVHDHDDEGLVYLLALGASDQGAEGRVVVATRGDAARFRFSLPPRRPLSLTLADAEAVRRSVGGATSAGLELWKDTARQLPEGDPVREAVVAALS